MKFTDLDHIQQCLHVGVPKVFPGKVVEEDVIPHEVVGVVGEAALVQLWSAAGVLARSLEIDHGPTREEKS